MNDWGYDCFARNLAAAIVRSAAPAAMTSMSMVPGDPSRDTGLN
jgi:hypothetical protein